MTPPETVKSSDEWLPSNGVLLHIGPHKTGTTALQKALSESKIDLRGSGEQVAPKRLQRRAAAAATDSFLFGNPENPPGIEEWRKLSRRAARAPHKYIASSEVFANADRDQIERMVTDLPEGRVRVLITVRPLEKILPSTWQQRVKNGLTISYAEWLVPILQSAAAMRVGEASDRFWHQQDHAALAQRWADAVGKDNVRILVVDTRRPGQLFRDLETLLGVPTGIVVPGGSSNRSLSVMEAEAVRQVNLLLNPEISRRRRHRWIARGAVIDLLDGRVPGPEETRIETPAWATREVRDCGRSIVERLLSSNIGVVGDLDVLLPSEEPQQPGDQEPEQVSTEILAHMMRGLYRAAAADTDVVPDPAETADPVRGRFPRLRRWGGQA